MPSFSPGAVNPITEVAAVEYKRELKEAKLLAQEVALSCIQIPGISLQKQIFFNTLSRYLTARSQEVFGNDAEEIRNRANFIDRLRTAPTLTAEKRLLQENNIRGFKGFFYRRLHNHLVERRESKELKPIRLD